MPRFLRSLRCRRRPPSLGARLIAAAGVAAVLLPAAVLRATAGEPWDLQPVRDEQGRFVISVPVTWQVAQTRGDRALRATSPEPPGTSPDTVDVFVRDMPGSLSPEGCARQVAWVMRWTIGRWTTLAEGPDWVGGLPAYTRVYLWRLPNGEERRSVQTCVPLGRRLFVVIGTTTNTEARVAEHFPEIRRVVETFQPGSAPPPPEPHAPSGDH